MKPLYNALAAGTFLFAGVLQGCASRSESLNQILETAFNEGPVAREHFQSYNIRKSIEGDGFIRVTIIDYPQYAQNFYDFGDKDSLTVYMWDPKNDNQFGIWDQGADGFDNLKGADHIVDGRNSYMAWHRDFEEGKKVYTEILKKANEMLAKN